MQKVNEEIKNCQQKSEQENFAKKKDFRIKKFYKKWIENKDFYCWDHHGKLKIFILFLFLFLLF